MDFTTHTTMRLCLLGHSLESELSSLLPSGPWCGAYGLVWVRGQGGVLSRDVRGEGGVLARDVRGVKIDFFVLSESRSLSESRFSKIIPCMDSSSAFRRCSIMNVPEFPRALTDFVTAE